MSYAFISPPVLRWARERSHLDIESLAKKIPVKAQRFSEWESGVARPTFIQAQKIAKVLHIPFGYLFLPTPPIINLPLPDLRTINDTVRTDFSIDLLEVISGVMSKQDWYRDYRKDQGYSEVSFVGKYDYNIDAEIVARDISSTLKLTIRDRISVRSWEEFYKLLINRAEDLGLWIMRSSIVGNNTHRRLDVDEFRGFAISDKLVPAIFINGADAKAAQIFTLIHEIAHLWFGSSGVSNIDFRNDKNNIQNNHEKKCNEIAAEVLVPKADLLKIWNKGDSVFENAERLCRLFKVSSIVVARRAFELDIILSEDFFDFYQSVAERWRVQKEQMKESDGGPSYYVNIPITNGRQFSLAVLNSVYSQNLLMRDGAKLLGLNPTTLSNFAKEVGIR